MTSSIEKKVVLSGAAVLGLFLVIAAVQYRTILRLVGSLRLVSHTLEVLDEMTRLEYAVEQAQQAALDFEDSGRDTDLNSYRSASQQSRSSLAHLRHLTADNFRHQLRVAQISPLVTAILADFDQSVASRSDTAADASLSSNSESMRVSEIESIVTEMRSEEHQLLQLRTERAAEDERQTVFILIVGSVFVLMIVVLGSLRLHHDLTERSRAESALRSSEQKFRTLAETAHDAIISSDRGGSIVFWNRGAGQIFGYAPGEALGRPIQMLVPERFQAAYSQGLAQYLAQPGDKLVPGTAELLGCKKDGTEFPIDLSYGAWVANQEIFFTALIRDLTDRKRTEQALRELSGRVLRLQDEERSRLARELHDGTSQALAAMHLHLAALENVLPQGNTVARASIDELISLVSSAGSELRTVTHLLHPPLLEQTGLSEAIRWYAEGFGQRSGIRVETRIEDALPRFHADFERAAFRIVQETLANIHRHSGSKMAQIGMELKGRSLTLEIKDQGRGIAPEILNGPARWGVGIRGMKERVRLLGGELDIKSDDNGTILRASLPIEAGATLPA